MPKIDFGTAPLRDPETGDIYLDKDGNVLYVEDEELLLQECKVALETLRGEEVYNLRYGFPMRQAVKNPFNIDTETLIRNAVLDTLQTKYINALDRAEVTDIQEDDGIWSVVVVLRSVNGNITNAAMEVDVPFQQSMA